MVDNFIKECYDSSYSTYKNSDYSSDIQVLINKNKLEFDYLNYNLLSKPLGIDTNLQQRLFDEYDADGFEFNGVSEVLNFIDEGISPLTLTISAVTGGIFGGMLFTTTTFFYGAVVGIAEFIILDAATGSMIVMTGFHPAEHPYITMALSFGVAAGAGFARSANAMLKAQNIDLLAEELASTTGRAKSEIKNIFKAIPKEEMNATGITKALNKDGIAITEKELGQTIASSEAKIASKTNPESVIAFDKEKNRLLRQLEDISSNSNVNNGVYFKSVTDRTAPIRFGKTYSDISAEYDAIVGMYNIDPEHIVRPLGLKYGNDGKVIGYEMENLDGIALTDYMENHEFTNELRNEIEETINKLHSNGYAHGDLNPDNIIILNNGTNFKIIDPVGFKLYFENFEAAKQLDFDRLVSSNSGTNYYPGQELTIVRTSGKLQTANVIQDLKNGYVKVGFTDLDAGGNVASYTKEVRIFDLEQWNPPIYSDNRLYIGTTPSFVNGQKVNIVRTSGKTQNADVISDLKNGYIHVGFADYDASGKLIYYTKDVKKDDLIRWQLADKINTDYFSGLKQTDFVPLNFGGNYNQKLPEVFAYPGTGGWKSREVIVFNKDQDYELNNFLNEAKSIISTSEEDRMFLIFNYTNKKINSTTIKDYTNGQTVAIGEYISSGTGVCRHRATLLKKAYDEVGINADLVRGDVREDGIFSGRHIWVQVKLNNGKEYIVDPMWGLIDDISVKRGRIADQYVTLYKLAN